MLVKLDTGAQASTLCETVLLNTSEKPQVVKGNQVNLRASRGEHAPAAGITELCVWVSAYGQGKVYNSPRGNRLG